MIIITGVIYTPQSLSLSDTLTGSNVNNSHSSTYRNFKHRTGVVGVKLRDVVLNFRRVFYVFKLNIRVVNSQGTFKTTTVRG